MIIKKMELYSRKNNIDSYSNIWSVKWYQLRLKDKKKPDFIDYWENIVFDWVSWNKWYWTSFSAPLISNKSVKILNIYPNISTNTVKWLLINYSSIEKFSDNWYRRWIQERHIWRWNIEIWWLLDDDNNDTINIVIEDYISNNEKKEYPIKLPEVEGNSIIWINRSISYNPPVDQNYHLKYCKFCVSSKMWSNYYETKKQDFFDTTKDKDQAYNEFSTWKKERVNDKYTRPLNWVNYFWNNHFWASNSYRFNLLNKDLYDELKDWVVIEIEWHTRNNFSFTQKFSLVITIDITSISNKEKFIDDFYKVNNDISIKRARIPWN